jgi:putrescine transport system substrate-binding protein
VKKRLPDVPLNSLDLLFKPEYASRSRTAALPCSIRRRK